MWNDFEFHARLLDILGSEQKAFRWIFTPLVELNHRTPMEVFSDGGRDRVMQVLEAKGEIK